MVPVQDLFTCDMDRLRDKAIRTVHRAHHGRVSALHYYHADDTGYSGFSANPAMSSHVGSMGSAGSVGSAGSNQKPMRHRTLLLSGGADCMIRAWNLETGDCLARVMSHTGAIQAFIPVPGEVGGRMKNAVMSVAADNSLSIYDLNELKWCVSREILFDKCILDECILDK